MSGQGVSAITLRPARAHDAAPLAVFAGSAFVDTYRELDDPHELDDYVAEHFTPAVMARVLGDPANVTLLAEAGSAIAGYVVVRATPPPACVGDRGAIEVGRFYLGAAFIGQGLGARLMRLVQAEAARQGARTLWLTVYDRNVRAVRFYERFGFVPVGGREFSFGGRMVVDPVYQASLPADATGAVQFEPAAAADLDALVALRIEAMRESLERVGRFDPQRARERFAATFDPALTRHVTFGGERVGFVVVRAPGDHLLLDHLYVRPAWQGRGFGAAVLAHVFARADAARLPVRVGALRESDSNRFYVRHGFELVERAEFDNTYVRAAR